MAKTERETYSVPRLRYRIPLAAGLIILVSGIIMSLLDHHAYGKSEEYEQLIEITGPQAIILGSILVLISLYYKRKLFRETEELNRRQ